jgi:hypothetical protein
MGKTFKKDKEFKPKGRDPLHKRGEQDWYNESFLPEIFDTDDDEAWEEYNAKTIQPKKNSDNKRSD